MDLVMLVCLAATPATCREERILLSVAPIDAMACMAAGPVVIPEWAEDHPAWSVTRWSCALAEGADRGARR